MTRKAPSQNERCAWCDEPIPPWAKSNSRTCSKPCRQKLARFRVAPASSAAARPLRFAYADPPYPGLARRLYRCAEVDHRELIERLFNEHPDGWALSTHASSLIEVGAMVRELAIADEVADVEQLRVSIWNRGSRSGIASRRARNAWEPLIVYGGRPLELATDETLDDVLTCSPRATPSSIPGAVIGMKSPAFAEWMFRQLGALRGDTMIDMFPGSGVVSRAWSLYSRSPDSLHVNTRRASRLEETMHGQV